jgi:hypothetical protein
MRPGIRNKNKVGYLTPDHLEEQADARASEAKQLPEGERDKMRFVTLRN